jgi:hypothetical protein
MAEPMTKLPLIGRDLVLIELLAKQVFKNLPHGTLTTQLRKTADRRGFYYEVQVTDDAGNTTDRVARVQITLDRVEDVKDA